ncbi:MULTISPECIES: hypothetical protein [Mesorhizobium]|uniref:hypothetical protein n=1 Tax=Mesorhizobium TaxID=68287 RepID=UPI00167AD86F|nr:MULTISPECIES: hypothetical protein [Mesorhizobium]MDX8435035.1 hypothetical protein [Mesorhizobium abyssinicae]
MTLSWFLASPFAPVALVLRRHGRNAAKADHDCATNGASRHLLLAGQTIENTPNYWRA